MELSITAESFEKVLSNGIAAGTTTEYSDAINVSESKQLVIRTHVGAITSTGTLVVTPQYSTDGTNYTDHATTISYGDTDDNKVCLIEFMRIPSTVRKVRLKYVRATANSVILSVTATMREGRKIMPVGSTGASALDATIKGVKRISLNV
jgi:hypothetical protein